VVPDPGEPLCAHRAGVQRGVVRRLRRGEPRPQDEIDLHGLSAAQARTELRSGMSDAVARGLRCLRIIHGRGRSSKGGTAVLKRELPGWLAEAGVGEHVVAFAPAPPRDGGAGATLVLLQRS
jgi:DNA-nicking Smr family endonuclease